MKFVLFLLLFCCKSIKYLVCFRYVLFLLFIRLNDIRKMVVLDMLYCIDEFYFVKLFVVWMCKFNNKNFLYMYVYL